MIGKTEAQLTAEGVSYEVREAFYDKPGAFRPMYLFRCSVKSHPTLAV